MPRRTRFDLVGITQHIIQRGNDRHACFFCGEDYQAYLRWLDEGARRYECRIHSYVLMTNHVHLLVTPGTKGGVSRMMQYLGGFYVRYVNRRYARTGTLWEGRYRSSLVNSGEYLLACYRELNPVRAGMVRYPIDYEWSSYRENASGNPRGAVNPHPGYSSLGTTNLDRGCAYRLLVGEALGDGQLDDIRESANRNHVFGSEAFRLQIEAMLKRQLGNGRPGRPSAAIDSASCGES